MVLTDVGTVVSFVMNGHEDTDTLLDTNLQQKMIDGISAIKRKRHFISAPPLCVDGLSQISNYVVG